MNSVMDQLTRDSLPHYRDELLNSISYIEELSGQLESLKIEAPQIVLKVQEGDLESYQCLSDFESEVDPSVIEEMDLQLQKELGYHEQISLDQDKELLELHNQLDALYDQLTEIRSGNQIQIDDVYHLKCDLQEKQLTLLQLQEFIDQQNQHNKQVSMAIKKKLNYKRNIKIEEEQPITRNCNVLKEKSNLIVEKEGVNITLRQKEQKKNRKGQKDEKKLESLFQQIICLTNEKEQLEEEIDRYLKEQEGTIESIMRELNHFKLQQMSPSHTNMQSSNSNHMIMFLEELKGNQSKYSVQLSENEILVLQNGQCVGRVRLKQEEMATNSFQKMVDENFQYSTQKFTINSERVPSDMKTMKHHQDQMQIQPFDQVISLQAENPGMKEEIPRQRRECQCNIF